MDINELFPEKKNEIAPELIDAVRQILKKNDSFPDRSTRRCGAERAAKYLNTHGLICSKHLLQKIAKDHLGRRSWGRA
jgi:hypothetical protein